MRRPALQSWAEYRVGASAAADAPLAVLFGWLGCRSDYLRKYAVVYNSLGVDTLAVNPSVPFTIFPTLADRATDDLLGCESMLSLLIRGRRWNHSYTSKPAVMRRICRKDA